jgi:hypothetical protein
MMAKTLHDVLTEAEPDSLWQDYTGGIHDAHDLEERCGADPQAGWEYASGWILRTDPAGTLSALDTIFVEVPARCSDPRHHPYGCDCETV